MSLGKMWPFSYETILLYSLVSSANSIITLCTSSVMSDTNSKNKMGPITDPWGTQLVTLLQADFASFITTPYRRSDKKPSTHCIILP